MYNYYRNEKTQQYQQKLEQKKLQLFHIKQEIKKKNVQLANNYDKRVITFLEKMSAKPYIIHDSIYERDNRISSLDNRKWRNASALHSLDYGHSINNSKHQIKKRNQSHQLTQSVHHNQEDNFKEISILDTFNPKTIEQRQPNKAKSITLNDSNIIKQNLRINLNNLECKHSKRYQPEKQMFYFNGLKSLTVQQRMYPNEELKVNISELARNVLEKCNIIHKKPT